MFWIIVIGAPELNMAGYFFGMKWNVSVAQSTENYKYCNICVITCAIQHK